MILQETIPSTVSAPARTRITCNLCGSTHSQPFCPSNGRGLVQCTGCGLVYVGERPSVDHLYDLYDASYFRNENSGEVGYTDYAQDEGNIRRTFTRRFAHIERFVQPGRLLDVGCALGFAIDVASQRGWQVEGMDISQHAVDYVSERFGHPVHLGSLDNLELEAGAYDLVTMWDVIEHVPDPKAYVASAARLLRSGGVLELATPDVGSVPARFSGRRWIGYKLSEEHIYYFSQATLRRMLDEAGFDVLHVRHTGKYVTLRLFLDRLGFYVPVLARGLALVERAFRLSEKSLYVNPFDIVAITARKR